MNVKNLFLMAVIAVIVLSACGNTSQSSEEILSSVNTAVALTSMSQPKLADLAMAAPTATPALIATIPAATATLIQPVSIPTNSYTATSVSLCDNSVYYGDVTIPDGTVLSPGETFTKTWKIQNNGTCTWNSNYNILFSSGDSMSGATTSIDQSVSPNAAGSISVKLTAPSTAGSYTGYWVLANASGATFGNYVYVQIVVSGDDSTSTPTATSSDSEEATATATPTEEPTSTPAS